MASFEQLTQNLTDTSQPITTRRAAVLEIAEIGGDQAFPFLLQALSDVAPSVRREAANALQKCDFGDATSALLDAIKVEENDLTLWTLIEVLGNIGTVTALPTLQELLSTALSPLTRREVQKSIDFIEARTPNIEADTVETEEEVRDHFDAPTGTQDFSDSSPLPVGQPEWDQENIAEGEDNLDDLPIQPDENIETASELPSIPIEETVSDEIDAPIVDSTIEQDPHSEETGPEEPSYSVKGADASEITAEDDAEDFGTSEPEIKTEERTSSTPALPVLVPNTSVVLYEEEEPEFKPNVFELMLRPNTYLSKRWVSRTRLYFVLFCLLIASTIALVYSQVNRRPRSPYLPNTEIAYINNPENFLTAGSFNIQQADYRRAIEELGLIRGVDVDSVDPVLYKNLGFAHFQENQYALAVEAYEFYLQTRQNKSYDPFVAEASLPSSEQNKTDASDYMIYNILGTSYKRLGHFDKARLAFETAIKIVPNEAEAYSNLAKLYSDSYQQKYLLAEALAYTAVRLNPDVAPYQDTLGWILSKSGRLNKATNTLQQAVRLQSDHVPTHYHLLEVAQKSMYPEKAIGIVQNDFIKKMRRTKGSHLDIIDVLSYIYETKSQKIGRLVPSLLHQRGIKR